MQLLLQFLLILSGLHHTFSIRSLTQSFGFILVWNIQLKFNIVLISRQGWVPKGPYLQGVPRKKKKKKILTNQTDFYFLFFLNFNSTNGTKKIEKKKRKENGSSKNLGILPIIAARGRARTHRFVYTYEQWQWREGDYEKRPGNR